MRSSLGIILLAALALCPGAGSAAADPPALGGTTTGGSGSSSTNGPCVDVQVGDTRVPDFDCINRQFRLQVEHAHMVPPPAAPIDTHSSSIQVGTANQAAAEQMMGNEFGKSAHPQRPPPPAFVPALPRVSAH